MYSNMNAAPVMGTNMAYQPVNVAPIMGTNMPYQPVNVSPIENVPYQPSYCYPAPEYGYGYPSHGCDSFVLIVVLFILLIIVGSCTFFVSKD